MPHYLHHAFLSRPAVLRRLIDFSKEKSFMFLAVGMMVASVTGCGELEPMVEPEMIDLQLTVDTLKTQVRDAQRNVAELRAELEARRQELADAQVARAQLDGRVREAERRVIEARQVIELQREELIAARIEREKLFRSNAPLHGRMKPLQKPSRKLESQPEEERDMTPAPAGASMRRQQRAQGVSSFTDDVSETVQPARPLATPATLRTEAPAAGQRSDQLAPSAPIRHISVKPGDTLWSLARKYGVSLTQLRSLNHLTDNQILVGQALRVPGDRVLSESSEKQGERVP